MEGWGGRLSKNEQIMNQAAKYRERLEELLNKRLRDLESSQR
jgi:glucose-6-phosphate dehydrogenase assembly protein OpcA